MSRFINYIRDTRGELAHVSWPTRKQAIAFTALVVLLSVFAAAYLGFFSYLFTTIIQKFFL